MRHLTYLGLLAGCLVVTAPLEILLRVRVYARWKRLLLALLPMLVLFLAWDYAAIRAGQWAYHPRYVLDIRILGRLPLEELLFFLVTPTCAVMTLEAVRRRRPRWLIGDEPPDDAPAGDAQ